MSMPTLNACTVNDLLMSCPDEQIIRLKNAWKAAAAGDWREAAGSLRNAAKEGTTNWHDQCAVLAVELDNKAAMADKEEFAGNCKRCGHQTVASKPGVVACKWGGCNGVVRAA
ncbi:hypothetical protein [Janthinobacterium sp. CAN_S7]|uniref:hypothetical protein n=1 Tax=Janthinobacterium sp. CAN_S7 TaxID=3071704 RepID=UPI00319D9BBA